MLPYRKFTIQFWRYIHAAATGSCLEAQAHPAGGSTANVCTRSCSCWLRLRGANCPAAAGKPRLTRRGGVWVVVVVVVRGGLRERGGL